MWEWSPAREQDERARSRDGLDLEFYVVDPPPGPVPPAYGELALWWFGRNLYEFGVYARMWYARHYRGAW